MSRACEREEAVVRAIVEGTMPGSLEAHVAACPECRETMAITAWMQDVARAAREAAVEGLPDASEIWWRAEVLERVEGRRRLTRRVVRPIAVFERGLGIAVALAAGLLAWRHGAEFVERAWETGVASIATDPSSIAAVGLAAAAFLALSTGILVERLREV